MRSQIATSNGRGGKRYRPYVFTEHGTAMLSGVLRSDAVVQVSIRIMNTFVEMRRFIRAKARAGWTCLACPSGDACGSNASACPCLRSQPVHPATPAGQIPLPYGADKIGRQISHAPLLAAGYLTANNAFLFEKVSDIELKQLEYQKSTDEKFDKVFQNIENGSSLNVACNGNNSA